jgi:arylsulfatase A-like enzyme
METKITRREFLKLMALTSLSYAFPMNIPLKSNLAGERDRVNLLVIVFDAWSASNCSLYGYPRQTTPFLDQLVDNAVVYHSHYAGGHYTPPGTASLLTGTLPWTHRAFNYEPDLDRDLLQKNVFHAFGGYYRFAYTHNPIAHHLLYQLSGNLDDLMDWEELYLSYGRLATMFRRDQDIAFVGWNRAMKLLDDGYAYSLFFSRINEIHNTRRVASYADLFPRGVPSTTGHEAFYLLENSVDYLSDLVQAISQPFLGYYHFYPPHEPYNTRSDFFERFKNDGYKPPLKPKTIFKSGSDSYVESERQYYDEFILYIDAEFNRLYQDLKRTGVLENTWIILTSDHGEMFERGLVGHDYPLFYQPLMHIPLVIFPPGQKGRIDVHDNTSAVDVLPTLLKVTGQEAPSWLEGLILPPFGTDALQAARDITSVQVEKVKDKTIQAASAMCVRDHFKAQWHFGHDHMEVGDEIIELYDLESDPEELHDLYPAQQNFGDELVGVLRSKMAELNDTYG